MIWIFLHRRWRRFYAARRLEARASGHFLPFSSPAAASTHFIGRELFDYLLGVLTRYNSAKESAVRGRVAEAFHRNFPDADVFLHGDTTYYFSNELLPGNEFKLVDTKRAPEWR